jgi:5-methylcytosine-specific restriction endonuclease McrA
MTNTFNRLRKSQKWVNDAVDLLPPEEFYKKYPQYRNRLRWQVFRAKGYQCIYCDLTGTHAIVWVQDPLRPKSVHTDLVVLHEDGTATMITLDHDQPASKGGKKTIENLNPCCEPHNSMKKDRTHEEYLEFLKGPGLNHVTTNGSDRSASTVPTNERERSAGDDGSRTES